MPTTIKDFSHKTLQAIKTPGDYRDAWSDVKGLILRVKVQKNGGFSKQWIWRYTLPNTNGQRETISPGTFPTVSVSEAREKVRTYVKGLRDGVNPKTQRDKERAAIAQTVQRHTVKEVALEYWDAHNLTWKNKKHRAQWKHSWMETYTFPIIGNLDVDEIRLADLADVLRPIWKKKHETAKKVTSAIGAVLEYAVAKGWRDEDIVNPCKQRERLTHILSKIKKNKEHQPSLHYEDAPSFYKDLQRAMKSSHAGTSGQLALEFAMLTGVRTNNVITLEWSEVDFVNNVINVPASKMKGSEGVAKDFCYPIIGRCLDILQIRKTITGGTGFVFTCRKGTQMSQGAMLETVKALCGVKGIKTKDETYKPKFIDRQSKRRITVHGFRSTLVSWAEDHGHKLEDCDALIAHTKGDENLAAYARGNKLEIRRTICEDFYKYITTNRTTNSPAEVNEED